MVVGQPPRWGWARVQPWGLGTTSSHAESCWAGEGDGAGLGVQLSGQTASSLALWQGPELPAAVRGGWKPGERFQQHRGGRACRQALARQVSREQLRFKPSRSELRKLEGRGAGRDRIS